MISIILDTNNEKILVGYLIFYPELNREPRAPKYAFDHTVTVNFSTVDIIN